ncbi:MAG: RNA pyrophosphohydrolase [Parvularculaceae bacterium]
MSAPAEVRAAFEGYRPNVGVALFNRRGEVFFGRRVGDFSDAGAMREAYRWQMPQGGVDPGETPAEAAVRELKEETGVVAARLLLMTPGWLAYDFPPELGKRWRGQRQKWAAMLFEGEDAEIDLMADDHQEFDDWRWGALEEAPNLIVPFKRAVYEDVVAAFAPLRDFLRDL